MSNQAYNAYSTYTTNNPYVSQKASVQASLTGAYAPSFNNDNPLKNFHESVNSNYHYQNNEGNPDLRKTAPVNPKFGLSIEPVPQVKSAYVSSLPSPNAKYNISTLNTQERSVLKSVDPNVQGHSGLVNEPNVSVQTNQAVRGSTQTILTSQYHLPQSQLASNLQSSQQRRNLAKSSLTIQTNMPGYLGSSTVQSNLPNDRILSKSPNKRSPTNKNTASYYKHLYEPVSNNNIYTTQLKRGDYLVPAQEKKAPISYIESLEPPRTIGPSISIVSLGASSLQGTDGNHNPKTNQDSYLVKKEKSMSGGLSTTFGVFDGHGVHGDHVSQHVRNLFNSMKFSHINSEAELKRYLVTVSKQLDTVQGFDVKTSGTTCTLIHVNSSRIFCAFVGDSRAIMVTRQDKIEPLSRDHKPDLPDEKARIYRSGGTVDRIMDMGPYRVWMEGKDYPGLAMSRSMGDQIAHSCGVIDEPEGSTVLLNLAKPLGICVASDGVWEFLSNEDVAMFMKEYSVNNTAAECAQAIVTEARNRWEQSNFAIDDITCVICFFRSVS